MLAGGGECGGGGGGASTKIPEKDKNYCHPE